MGIILCLGFAMFNGGNIWKLMFLFYELSVLTLEYITKRSSPIGCGVSIGNKFGTYIQMMDWGFVPNCKWGKGGVGGSVINYS